MYIYADISTSAQYQYSNAGNDTYQFGANQPGVRGAWVDIDAGGGYDDIVIDVYNWYFLWAAAKVKSMKGIEKIVGYDTGGDPFFFWGKLDLRTENKITYMYGIEGFYGDETANEVTGSDFAEKFVGNGGNDIIRGYGGNDVIYGDVIYNNYNYNYGSSVDGNDVLYGGDGDDYIDGGGKDDKIYGDAGHDTLIGGSGNDTIYTDGHDEIDGGDGIDTLYFIPSAVGDVFDWAYISAHTKNVEFFGGSTANDRMIGDSSNNSFKGDDGNDFLSGLGGNDTLLGEAGDDTLNGGLGDDLLDGGDGNDTASYSDATAGVTVDLSKKTAQNTIAAGMDTLIGIENLIGSAFDDRLTGDAGDNVLNGGAGNDALIGGDGNDTLIGGDGVDGASYDTATSAVTVNLAIKTAQNTGGAGTDTLSGIENLYGSKYDDRLTGDDSDNLLQGAAGNDTLIGGGGNDVLNGGTGNDVLDGGLGIDTATYANAGSGVTVNLALSGPQSTGAGADTLISIENLTGSAYNDRLTGDAGANTLNGGAGDDVLTGGRGADYLIGGSGADTFQFAFGDGTDRIADFSVSQGDLIAFNAASFGLSPTSKISDYLVFGSAAPDHAHGYFMVTASGISWDADGNGAGAAVQIAQFSAPVSDLNASAFVFI